MCRSTDEDSMTIPTFSEQLLDEGHVIYDDSLGLGWSFFDNKANNDFDSTVDVFSGEKAIQVSWEDGGQFSFFKDTPLDISAYDWLVFNIHGGTTADQQIMLGLLLEGQSVGPHYDLSGYLETGHLEPGQWHQIVMPLSDLNMAGGNIDVITFLGQNMLQTKTFYIDDIRFVASELGAVPSPTPMLPAPTPGPTPSTGQIEGGYIVYDDGLSEGWSLDIWGGTADLFSSTNAYQGSNAIETTIDPGSGFTLPVGSFDVSTYDYLVFYLNGGDTADQELFVEMMSESGEPSGPRVYLAGYIEGGSLQPGEWHRVTVPLNLLNPEGKAIGWIDFGDASGNGASTFFIDEIRFVSAGP